MDTDCKVSFIVGGKTVGYISSSLETIDSSPILIPKRILNKITKTNSSVEIMFHVEHVENNLK
ncbi:MAG TPA: hypothetical protein VN703_10100 [Candidatus Sulfopaludibacter sp.]|jgi:hypothetical protein|nr:hypothetical protein [Candidatus Sulfopaludibacter sp.]